MALSNAERQRLFRERRKVKLAALRNSGDSLPAVPLHDLLLDYYRSQVAANPNLATLPEAEAEQATEVLQAKLADWLDNFGLGLSEEAPELEAKRLAILGAINRL